MATGFPVKANYATGDVLTAANMNDLAGTLNYLDPTAKGDLFPASDASTLTRLAVGTDGQILTADSTTATGLKWAAASSSSFVGCYLTRGAVSGTVTGGVDFKIAFTTETYDTNSFHDNTTNNTRITIPSGKAGKYLLNGFVRSEVGCGGYFYFGFFKNGTPISVSGDPNQFKNYGANNWAMDTHYIADLAVGDYIELVFSQSSGGTANIYAMFAATYLGA